MYVSAYNAEELCLLGKQIGAHDEHGFQAAVDAATRLADDARRAGRSASWIAIIEDSAAPPDANARQRMAAVNQRFVRLDIAVVTTSRIHRAIITALTWLSPQSPRHELSTHDTFDAAVEWMNTRRSAARYVFTRLLTKVEQQASAPGARMAAPTRLPKP